MTPALVVLALLLVGKALGLGMLGQGQNVRAPCTQLSVPLRSSALRLTSAPRVRRQEHLGKLVRVLGVVTC